MKLKNIKKLMGCSKCGHPQKAMILVLAILLTIFFTFLFEIVEDTQIILLKMNIKDYTEIHETAQKLAKGCLSNECVEYNIYRYVIKDVEYRNDSMIENILLLNNDPLETLKNGNDCDGKVVLAIDMLKSLGYTSLYIVLQGTHACWMVKDGKTMRFYGCDETDIVEIERVV